MLEEVNVVLTPGWLGKRTPKALVLGLGLIGGSWAGALHIAGWEVSALDVEEASLEGALAKGWVQTGWCMWKDVPHALDVDLVVLALPLPILAEAYEKLPGRIPQGAIVTDVASVKTEICKNAGSQREKNSGQGDFYFIGGHPMTGSERSGFTTANPHLFRGYPYVLSPEEDCPSLVIEKLLGLLQRFGALVVFREPRDHDMEVAMVSHLPHLLAVALTLATRDIPQGRRSAFALAGRSFQDVTRIADSSPEMWQEILLKNSEAVLAGLTLWEQRIEELKEYVSQGDGEAIANAFREAREAREALC